MKNYLLFLFIILSSLSLQSCFSLGEAPATITIKFENKEKLAIDSVQFCEQMDGATLTHSVLLNETLNQNDYDVCMGGLDRRIDFNLKVFLANKRVLVSGKCHQNSNTDRFKAVIYKDKVEVLFLTSHHVFAYIKFGISVLLVIFLMKSLPFYFIFKPSSKRSFMLKHIGFNLIYLLVFVFACFILTLLSTDDIIIAYLLFIITLFTTDYLILCRDESLERNQHIGLKSFAVNLFYLVLGCPLFLFLKMLCFS